MSSLTDLYISDSYTGLLHAGGVPLSTDGVSKVFDGSGQESALSLGKSGNGATVSGQLSTQSLVVGTESYPSVPGPIGAVVFQQTSGELGLTTDLPSSSLSASGVGGGTYNSIDSITVTEQGIVTNITEFDDSEGTTITSTTYITPVDLGNVTFQGETVGSSWYPVNLPSIFNGAKGGIFFLDPLGSTGFDGTTKIVYYASPDKQHIYPIGSRIGDNDDETNIGFQFQCPVANNRIYLTRSVPIGDEGSDSETYKITGLAKQR